MVFSPMERMAISEFKATCLAVLERVRRTGQPLVVTRRGEDIAEISPPSLRSRQGGWLGVARGTGRITGDVLIPAADDDEWEALGG